MSNLDPLEQSLFNIARGALPSLLFTDGMHDFTSELAAFAKQLAPVYRILSLRQQDTFITGAAVEALGQHAKDRGTRRQSGESNEALQSRLRYILEDSVTVAAVVARAAAILTSYKVVIPSGYPGITELRRDKATYGRGDSIQVDCVAAASIVDGETFVIGGMTYEFDRDSAVAAGNVRVNIATSITATDVATAVLGALKPRYGALAFQSSSHVVVRRSPGTFSDDVANAGFVVRRQGSYFSRGYRYASPARASTTFVIMLPYETSEAAALSVAEALRQVKSGGIEVLVERRLNP